MNDKPTYEELMALYNATKDKLDLANKDIENKNRDIESKNEEIESKSEELRAKNLELETKNKDIESKNEELRTKNLELETKDKELENKNIEIENKNKELETKLKELDKKEEEIKQANLIIQELLAKLENKDIKLKKQLTERFGIKSDKKSSTYANEAEAHASVKIGESKKRPGRKLGSKDASNFDMSKIEYHEKILDIENKVCESCGHPLISTNDLTSYKIDIIPAKVVLTKYIVKQYKCPNCIESNIYNEVNCFDNESFLTPSLGAYIVNSKYNYALPLYRLESIFKQLGAPLSRQQLCNYSINVAEKLEPIYKRLKEYMVHNNVGVLHADETTLKVIENKGRQKSYVWLYATTLYDNPIYIYEYQNSREACHPQKFLKDYKGYLICDDYHGYDNINNVKPARCWFHAKKKFSELVKILKPEQRKTSQAAKIEQMISNIIYVDNTECKKKGNTPNKILEERKLKLKPLIDEYFTHIEQIYKDCDKTSELGKAIKYSICIKEDLSRCLEDGHIELTNNLAERGIKPFVILRKNALFSNTKNGAEATTILMSIVQTAKINLVKPDEYIKYVLERIDDTKISELDKLLPFSKEIPEQLRYKRKDLD